MAVGALLAVAHDILITVGLYALFQFEVTPPTVIAFLTIMGYSLYDTLVVFDKVRDNEHMLSNSNLTYTSVVEKALNQVFMRSVNTSITSILPVVSVLVVGSGIMGAVTLREFALALLIGLIIGTFSSLFVAAPTATILRNKFGDADSDSNRSYRLSEAVKKRSKILRQLSRCHQTQPFPQDQEKTQITEMSLSETDLKRFIQNVSDFPVKESISKTYLLY